MREKKKLEKGIKLDTIMVLTNDRCVQFVNESAGKRYYFSNPFILKRSNSFSSLGGKQKNNYVEDKKRSSQT